MPANHRQPQKTQFIHHLSMPILPILPILILIISLLQTQTNSLYTPSTQVVCCEYVHAFMLDNCSFISIISFVRTRPQRWVISEKEGVYDLFNTTGYNRSIFNIKIVDASWQFFYLGAWSNKVDQIGYIALDADRNKFAQMIKIDTNSSYRFTLMSDITFMCYINKRSILIIDNEYPYRIFNGSIKNNTWSQVYSYPPILLTPTQKIICNKYSNCIWLMKNNMFVGYPMLNQPIFMKFKDQEINCFVFATVNGTNFLYTGMHSGLVYQWEEIGLYQYRPIRMLANLHSRPIHNMVVIRNQSLFVQSLDFKKQIIYLPTSQVYDSLNSQYDYSANMTVGCEENDTYPPFLFRYSMIDYDPINDQAYQGTYVPLPTACPIGFQCNTFHKIKCFNYTSSIQHTPGLFGTVVEYECIIDNSVIEMDSSLVPPIANITGCLRYTKRSDPVCIECASEYELVYLNGTSYNNEFQLTTCRTNSSNTNTNQNTTNNNTGYNDSSTSTNSSSIDNTTNNTQNSTNSTYNDSMAINNTTPVILPDNVPISPPEPENILSQTAKNIISTISSSIQATITPFYYIKNILQLTLFAFTIHGLLNLWILASLYYFLPLGTNFLKDILLMMWKIYNTSALALFNISPPTLPRLNNAQSDMIYGDITISNDFLEFTFDPFVMFSIALVNFVAFYYLRKILKKICTTERKFKFSWLKFEMFESVSDIIIELLPVLFLPCANFVFNPHFGDYYQRINLLLFSAMAGVGVIFPFFYFSKLVKDKNGNQKAQKLQKSIKNKKTENKAQLECKVKHKTQKRKRKHKNAMKPKKAQKSRSTNSRNLANIVTHANKTLPSRKQFIFTKCKEIDDFLNCILTLSIPITVTMANINIFFAANGIIILYGLVNSLLMTKKKFGIFFYWLYFLAYHICFVIMSLYVREDGSQTDVYVYASFSALVIVVISLLHQIVKILYNTIKFIKGACKSHQNKNKVINLSQQNIAIQATKKSNNPKNNEKRYEKMSFKQYMQNKQMQQKMAQIKDNSFRNIDAPSENTKYSNLSDSSNGYFFKQQLSAFASQIMPLANTMAAVVQSRREKRKSKLRKERLDRRFNANGMKVQRWNEQRSRQNAYEIVSENSYKELWQTAKMQ